MLLALASVRRALEAGKSHPLTRVSRSTAFSDDLLGDLSGLQPRLFTRLSSMQTGTAADGSQLTYMKRIYPSRHSGFQLVLSYTLDARHLSSSPHSSLPLPNPPGNGNSMLTSFVYFLHFSSPPHFFSAERSSGGTPEAYRRRTYENTGERSARVRAGWGTAARASRGGPAWSTTSPR